MKKDEMRTEEKTAIKRERKRLRDGLASSLARSAGWMERPYMSHITHQKDDGRPRMETEMRKPRKTFQTPNEKRAFHISL